MKFISNIKNNKEQEFKIEIPFEDTLIEEVFLDKESGYFQISYNARKIEHSSVPLFVINIILLLPENTDDCADLTALLFVNEADDTFDKKHEIYSENGIIDCSVEMNAEEKIKFLVTSIKKLSSKS